MDVAILVLFVIGTIIAAIQVARAAGGQSIDWTALAVVLIGLGLVARSL